MGNVKGIPPGDVQRMSAGSGVRHSEFNHAKGEQTHFLQIWIEPNVTGIDPGYEQKTVPESAKRGQLALVAAPPADAKSADYTVQIHADARMFAGLFNGAETAHMSLDLARKAYIFLVRGSLQVNGQVLQAGDAAMLQDEAALNLTQGENAEVLVFDLSA
jgi:hypothetical protein